MSTHSLAIVNWNRALLYQDGVDSHHYFVKPSIVLPAGWEYATALRGGSRVGNRVDFAVTPLNMLVDSPLDMGRYVQEMGSLARRRRRSCSSTRLPTIRRDLDIPASAARGVPARAGGGICDVRLAPLRRLPRAAHAQRRDRLSRHRAPSIQRRSRAPTIFSPIRSESLADGDLITHEFSHSWNGKYRRPGRSDDAELSSAAEYRSAVGLRGHEPISRRPALVSLRAFASPITIPSTSRRVYADMDYETGRATTPLIDLTTGAPYYYDARGDYPAIRRTSGDFYDEGELIWLDVDTIIRERSHGARSLDTFLHRFTAAGATGPDRRHLHARRRSRACSNDVEPYDWHAFFEQVRLPRRSCIRRPTNWRAPVGDSSTLPSPTSSSAAAKRRQSVVGMVRLRRQYERRGRREGRARGLAGVERRPRARHARPGGRRTAVFAATSGVRREARGALDFADFADRHANGLVSNAVARLSRRDSLSAPRAHRRNARHARRRSPPPTRRRQSQRRRSRRTFDEPAAIRRYSYAIPRIASRHRLSALASVASAERPAIVTPETAHMASRSRALKAWQMATVVGDPAAGRRVTTPIS